MVVGIALFKFKNVWQWTVPFCAFFTAFTMVMTILILSTDFKSHHYVHFNNTNVWEFEDLYQDNPNLISVIRENYIVPPGTDSFRKNNKSKMHLPGLLFSLINHKRGGVFFECGGGSRGVSSGSEFLESKLMWYGLVTQPHLNDFNLLQSISRPRSYLANVCISPITTPKHAEFRRSSLDSGILKNSTLRTVPCFPLYSLMLAMNSTVVDLVVLNLMAAELQILKTIPMTKVQIGLIMVMQKANSPDGACCQHELLNFFQAKGYRQVTECPTKQDRCYFTCIKSNNNCPPL